MSHMWIRRWCEASFAGTLVMLGCSHPQHELTSSVSNNNPSPHVYQMASGNKAPISPVVTPAPADLPPTIMTAEPAVPDPAPTPTLEEPATKEVKPASFEEPTVGAREEVVPRRSFADISAKPCYAHGPDYTWLTGELQMLHPDRTWHLRYASVDEVDRFGGSVTLADTGPMESFTNGQCVRVEGSLDNAESHDRSPLFHVRSIQPVSNP